MERTGTAVQGSFEWGDNHTSFTFTPEENLQIGTTYEIVHRPGKSSERNRSKTT